MAKVTAAEAAQALRDKKGFITQAAKQLGISRRHLHRLIEAHPTIKEALEDAKAEMKDFTESKIYKGINRGNTALIIFYAKTQMKDRGYTEKQEIDQRTTHIEVDLSSLTEDQLKRLAAGEDIANILADE